MEGTMARSACAPIARSISVLFVIGFPIGIGTVLWAYWTTLGEVSERWAHDPQYSHGYLVPGFAVLLLWLRRDRLDARSARPSWWGVPVLLTAVAARLAGTWFSLDWLEAVALLPCIGGICLVVGGRAVWRW